MRFLVARGIACAAGESLVVGEHTVEILRWLGHQDEQIARYRKDGVIIYPEGALER